MGTARWQLQRRSRPSRLAELQLEVGLCSQSAPQARGACVSELASPQHPEKATGSCTNRRALHSDDTEVQSPPKQQLCKPRKSSVRTHERRVYNL